MTTWHVYPLKDYREHETSGESCWCNPRVDEDGLVVHNSMDGRELVENGERLIQ